MACTRSVAVAFGLAMVAWDGLGHGCGLLARLTGPTGAWLWNTYSRLIWPSIINSIVYDLFWFSWFSTAIGLIAWGHFSSRHAT
jgi:hypothetical protein